MYSVVNECTHKSPWLSDCIYLQQFLCWRPLLQFCIHFEQDVKIYLLFNSHLNTALLRFDSRLCATFQTCTSIIDFQSTSSLTKLRVTYPQSLPCLGRCSLQEYNCSRIMITLQVIFGDCKLISTCTNLPEWILLHYNFLFTYTCSIIYIDVVCQL